MNLSTNLQRIKLLGQNPDVLKVISRCDTFCQNNFFCVSGFSVTKLSLREIAKRIVDELSVGISANCQFNRVSFSGKSARIFYALWVYIFYNSLIHSKLLFHKAITIWPCGLNLKWCL